MHILPPLETVKDIAATQQYDVLPLSCEILSDFITPIEAMRILKNVSTHCYMLESAQADDRWGRYTFLGFDPKLEITCIDGKMKAGGLTVRTDDPSQYLRELLSSDRSPRFDYLPSFTGGLVGYFSYDYLKYSEPSVRCGEQDEDSFKDVDLMLFDKVIAFDHVRQKIVLIVNMALSDVEVGYNKAKLELEQLVSLLKTGEKKQEAPGRLLGEVTPLFSKEQFCAMVETAKHHIREGDIFQIVLSNRLSAPFEGSLLDTYRVLRTINPSPYMFYFSGTDVEVAGASPETLVKLKDGVLHTFPLAGTRPRGKTDEEDKALEESLLHDEKELAEHNMLVDLGRNDLGKVSKFGTVQVEKLHSIERYLDIACDYEAAGADCISCLTEPKWFLGSDDIFREIRAAVSTPMLRKDFTVSDYQLYQSRLMGADCVLLICALLDTKTLAQYLAVCDELGLSALVETHDADEIRSAVAAGAKIIGVNNRNLKDFSVDFSNAARLRDRIPPEAVYVAESGVQSTQDVAALRSIGADAVLIGETLMRAPDKARRLAELRGNL